MKVIPINIRELERKAEVVGRQLAFLCGIARERHPEWLEGCSNLRAPEVVGPHVAEKLGFTGLTIKALVTIPQLLPSVLSYAIRACRGDSSVQTIALTLNLGDVFSANEIAAFKTAANAVVADAENKARELIRLQHLAGQMDWDWREA